MKWSERYCITWSLTAISFSLGCISRETESVGSVIFQSSAIGFHALIITAHVVMYHL